MMPDILKASLAASPVTVEAASRSWIIQPLPASAWIGAVHSDNCPWSVFPGLLTGDDLRSALDLLADGDSDDHESRLAGFSAIRQASGRPWWEALRLVAACDDQMGSLVGALCMAGIDPDRIPFARWCAAVYATMTNGADSKELMKFNAKLQAPPNIPEAFEESGEDDFAAMVQMARSLPGMSTG
jgi:hypothetical protein